MGHSSLAPGSLAPGPGPQPGLTLARWLYTNNPFYVISAALVFVGLRMSFDARGQGYEAGLLMLGLVGYTLLLAVTAWGLIRLGEVWNDVRMMLLLVVLMFLAISVSFDYTLVARPELGLTCVLGGWLFAVVVSEALLGGLKLPFPSSYRVPYHLILALCFLYPILLARLADQPGSPELQWALFGFAPLAGLAFLALLPAVRRGAAGVRGEKCPWPWPLYPWSLFGLLALCVAARSYSLSVSFHFVTGSRTLFGPYLLVPLALALDILLLEAGLVSKRRGLVRFALIVPSALVVLALVGHRTDPVYLQFLEMYVATLGATPAYLTLLATLGVFGIAAVRGVRPAADALAIGLAALALIGPGTLDLSEIALTRAWPLLLAGGLEVALAARRRDPWRGLLASVGLMAAAWLMLPEAWSEGRRAIIVFHLGITAALAVGAWFSGLEACVIRRSAAVLLTAAGLFSILEKPTALVDVPVEAVYAYPLLLAALTLGYGVVVGDLWFAVLAALAASSWTLDAAWRGYRILREMVAGLDHITLGLACFALAVGISLLKTGAFGHRAQRPKPVGSEDG